MTDVIDLASRQPSGAPAGQPSPKIGIAPDDDTSPGAEEFQIVDLGESVGSLSWWRRRQKRQRLRRRSR